MSCPNRRSGKSPRDAVAVARRGHGQDRELDKWNLASTRLRMNALTGTAAPARDMRFFHSYCRRIVM
jgi:hypothetical protein